MHTPKQNILIPTLLTITLLICTSCSAPPNPNTATAKISKKEINTSLNQTKEGKKEGLWRSYYQNGQLKKEGSYTNDLKEGLHKEWQDDGILLVEGLYANGKANGIMKWFHEKGHLAGSGNMIDDIREGPWTICDIEENGFCIEANFKDGKRDGIWKIYYDKTNDKLWKEQTWKDDKVVSERCWDEEGVVIECKGLAP